jgi:hypothetical protein
MILLSTFVLFPLLSIVFTSFLELERNVEALFFLFFHFFYYFLTSN